MAYLIDSDVLITASRGPYAFALCPGFWEWLDVAHERGEVLSITEVQDEIAGMGDELSDWASQRPSFWLPPTAEVVAAQASLYGWAVSSTQYNEKAKRGFQSGADAPLVARAQIEGHTLVTHETATNEVGRIKIPVAAAEVGVRTMSPYAMLRHEGVRFVVAATGGTQPTLFGSGL